MKQIENGFTFYMGGKDYFIITDKQNRTRNLVQKILKKCGLPTGTPFVETLLYSMQKATCELKTLPDGRKYYEITGKNFGGHGSFVDDGKTEIVEIL